MREPGTFERLLLATEHGEFDVGSEALALELARRGPRQLAVVIPIVSNPEFDALAPELAAEADNAAAAKVSAIEAAARAAGVQLQMLTRHNLYRADAVIGAAEETEAELIVIRRRGKRALLTKLLVGEMVHHVLSGAPCSVLVVPRAAVLWTRGVLVGVDPVTPSTDLIEQAAGLARASELPLHVVTVLRHDEPQARAAAQALVTGLAERARSRAVRASAEVRIGSAHEELVAAAAARGADLLVVTRHGSAHRFKLGNTVHKLIGLATVPVFVHHAAASGVPS